jgi:hypothetical protein
MKILLNNQRHEVNRKGTIPQVKHQGTTSKSESSDHSIWYCPHVARYSNKDETLQSQADICRCYHWLTVISHTDSDDGDQVNLWNVCWFSARLWCDWFHKINRTFSFLPSTSSTLWLLDIPKYLYDCLKHLWGCAIPSAANFMEQKSYAFNKISHMVILVPIICWKWHLVTS